MYEWEDDGTVDAPFEIEPKIKLLDERQYATPATSCEPLENLLSMKMGMEWL